LDEAVICEGLISGNPGFADELLGGVSDEICSFFCALQQPLETSNDMRANMIETIVLNMRNLAPESES